MEAFFLLKKFEIYKVSHKNIIMKMNFENWYNKMVVENEAVTTVSPSIADKSITTDPIVAAPSREDIMSDVDSIMTQLDQLSAQVKEDFDIEILDESLILEGAWDDTKGSFGELFSDPVFQLVGLGLAGIIGALGLSVKAIKDTKRNGAIGKQVLGDYAKLKQLKLQGVKLEAIQQQLEEKKEEVEAEGGRKKTQFESLEILSEAEPKAKAPLNNVQKIAAAKAEKEKIQKAQAAQAKKDAADAKKNQTTQKNEPVDKTTADDENAAKQKMREKLEAQISAIAKKRDTLDASINTFEQALDAKYAEEKITGFGSKKVSTLIASAKDGIAQEVAEARLKFFGETMSDEARKELQDSLKAITKRSAERKAQIDKEAKKNAEKAKEVADKDEEVKQALEDMKKKKNNPQADSNQDDAESTDDTTDQTTEPSGPSDAEKAALAQQNKNTKDAEDAEKYKSQRAEAGKKKQARDQEEQDAENKEASKNTKDGKLDRIEDLIKKEEDKVSKNPEAEKIKSKISEYEKAIEDLKNKEKKDKADQDKIDMISTAVDAEKKKLSKVSGSEKLDKLKKLKDEIAAKENWQLEGTELGRLYEMEISRLEAEYAINESTNMSIADKFRMLLG